VETFSDILVGIDLSRNCVPALRRALSMASKTDASVTGLFVVPDQGEEYRAFEHVYKQNISRNKLLENYALPRVEEWVREFKDIDQEDLEIVARVGNPAEEIIEYAKENANDLIVMGTHGRTGFQRLWLGSVAERVVRTAPVPVLTIRSEEQTILIEEN